MSATHSPRRPHIEQIISLFSQPPTLREVALKQLQATLNQRFPSLHLRAEGVSIGTPVQADQYHYSPLADEVLVCLAGAEPLRYVEDYHQVFLHQREIHVRGGPPLADIEQVINQLGPSLLDAWLEQLQDWWRGTVPVNTTRWAYLSDDCLALLYDSPKPPGMNAQQFGDAFPRAAMRASRPDHQWSLHDATLPVHTVYVRPRGSAQPAQMLPLLILGTWLFSPATGLHLLERVDDIDTRIPDYLNARLAGQALEWFVQAPWGDPFDALAASYAERQRADTLAIDRTVPRTPAQFQAMLDYITDPSRWFESVLTPFQLRVQDQLPLWLIHASAADSLAYAGALQAMVVAGGQGFLDGIAPIRTFAAEALKGCLRKERRAHGIEPDDIELTYHIVTAAMTPGGFATGEVHPLTLTLTDLALENLGGFPHLPSAIKLKGVAAPDWMTATLLTGCVTEVDIGQAYPALLRQKLVDDPAERLRRETLFTQQLRAQLPLLALQMKLQGENGLTDAGYRLVQAALLQQPEAALWPLAFKASPTSAPDTVLNLYVIGSRHSEDGPHLLYQPLFSPSLREFASAQALFDAIGAPGPLQDTVLAWLPPRRQAVYANGGFQEPHVQHFLAGDEFTVPDRPAPVRLSKQLLDADPLPGVFASTVQALVSLAERESVSNAEQRWMTFKEGGWLLFNSLLPFLRGPVALVGWMLQVMDSVHQDVPAISTTDPAAQAKGVMDLLTNLVLILAHRASPHEVPASLDLQHPAFEPTPRPAPTTLVRGPLEVPLRAAGGWSNARDTLAPAMQARLERLSLKAFARPWPARLPGAQVGGRLDGVLFNAAAQPPQWQVLVRGHVYRARVTDNSVRVISADGRENGPWLKLLDTGGWEVDLRLRLLGGQPDYPRVGVDSESRRQQLEQEYRQYGVRRETANRAMVVAYTLKTSDAASVTAQQRATAASRYTQELQNKLDASLLELQCLKDLQALKPRAGYERELSTSLEGVILGLQQLLVEARSTTLAINTRLEPLLDRVQSLSEEEAALDINLQAHQTLIDGLRQLADSNENAIRWRTQKFAFLKELERVPKFGQDKARALQLGLPTSPSVLELQSLQVTALWAVALNTEGPRLDEDFFQGLDDTIQRARWASGSQAQLEELAPHSTELRIELLESFNRVYAQTDDRIEFWRAMAPDKFHLVYLDKLQQLFSQLHAEADRELSTALAPATPATPAPRTPLTPRAPRKNIIRTRNQELYVAQLKITTGEEPAEVAEVVDAQNTVIASFTHAADGVWEPVRKPAATRAGSMSGLNSLIEQGQALRAEVEKAIGEVLRMARTANEPQSLQDILEQRADKLRQCAETLHRHLQYSEPARLAATQRARARTEVDALRAAASRLSEQGLRARLSAIKARLPTQSGVDVLVSHHEASIFRQGGRVAVAGSPNDWLQTYVVIDVHTREAFCYAHFHYERQTSPDDHFNAAHLKTSAQHRMGKQTQAQAQAQAFASIQAGQGGRVSLSLDIHRGEINRRMARKLFFDAPLWTPGG